MSPRAAAPKASSPLRPVPRSAAPHIVVRALARARNGLTVQVRAAECAPDGCFPEAFARLVASTEAVFRREEILMETVGFPGLREQLRENALLLNALHHAAPRVEAGEHGIGREVLAVLPALLSLHRFCGLRMLATARGTVLALRRGRPRRH